MTRGVIGTMSATGCFFVGLLSHHVMHVVRVPQSWSIYYDPVLSFASTSLLDPRITCVELSRHDASSLMKLLQQEVPVIQALEVCYKGCRHAHVKIEAYRPQLSINTEYVMLCNGLIARSDFFADHVRESLPAIGYPDDSTGIVCGEYCTALLSFMGRLPEGFFEQYSVIWHNKTDIVLYDKQCAQFCLRAHAETQFDDALVHAIASIKKVVQKRTTSRSSKGTLHRMWRADVRFKDYIVLSSITER